jgi:cytochrome c553
MPMPTAVAIQCVEVTTPNVPSISGRSPSYITRQLYEFQHGVRTGAWSPLMSNVVTNLTEDDLISISAYLASLKP